MSVTRRELREYLGPGLSRKSFRFSRLRGMVREETLQSLRFAKAFARPEAAGGGRKRADGIALMRELSLTEPVLRLPVMEALRRLSAGAGNGDQGAARAEAMERIHRILLECGVHAAFGRPSSAGLMLHDCDAAGIPLRIYLGESYGESIGRGRINGHDDGSWSIELDLTQTAARLMQALDYWVSDPANPPSHLDSFRLALVHAPKDRLLGAIRSRMENGLVSGEELPVHFALDVSCLRLLRERFENMAGQSQTPQGFLLDALNLNVGWVLAHEIAHMQEGRAGGTLRAHPVVREAFAYLLQAVYSDPADALRTMMLRGFDVTAMMPSFDASIRAMGPHAFCLERHYLRGWAKGMLDALSVRFGRAQEGKCSIDHSPIVGVQSQVFLNESDLPLVEKALCNPNRRVDASLLDVRPAQPA